MSHTMNRKIPPQEGVCIIFCCGCSCAYVSYAGHGNECVTEMVRVESTESPLSAMAGVQLLPKVQAYAF